MRLIHCIEELPPAVQLHFMEVQKRTKLKSLIWCKELQAGNFFVYQFIRRHGSGTKALCVYPTGPNRNTRFTENFMDYDSLVRSFGPPTFDPRASLGALPYIWRS